jgi:hypothetical protein
MLSRSENIMSLKNLIKPYRAKRDTGLLSVKVEGNEHLVKIYFELGMVAGLTIGTLKNEACFNILGTCTPLGSTFLKGYKTPDFAASDHDAIDAKLEELFASYPVTGAMKSDANNEQIEKRVKADNLVKLESDFINYIGPIGRMIIDTAYAEIGYVRGKDISAVHYSLLIDRLQGELPDEHHSVFAAKYAMGLALENDDR